MRANQISNEPSASFTTGSLAPKHSKDEKDYSMSYQPLFGK